MGGFLAASGMEIFVESLQPFPVHMRVLLRGGNGRVAQHFLHAPQLGASRKQMGRETVPKGVRANFGM